MSFGHYEGKNPVVNQCTTRLNILLEESKIFLASSFGLWSGISDLLAIEEKEGRSKKVTAVDSCHFSGLLRHSQEDFDFIILGTKSVDSFQRILTLPYLTEG